MKNYTYIICALLALLLAGCGGASQTPEDLAAVQALLADEIAIMANGINREDFATASQPVSGRFVMGDNVKVRFPGGDFQGAGVGAFRNFFSGVFAVNANIVFSAEILGDIDLQGHVATVVVRTNFNSVRIDRIPPESWAAGPFVDYFVFQTEGVSWRLVSWDEGPEHMQGEGGTV